MVGGWYNVTGPDAVASTSSSTEDVGLLMCIRQTEVKHIFERYGKQKNARTLGADKSGDREGRYV